MIINKLSYFTLSIGLLMVGSLPLYGQSDAYDLDDCIQYALSHNRDMQNARFDAYIAKARAKELLSAGYPQIDAKAEVQYFPSLPTQILPGEFNLQQDIVTIDGKPYPLTRLDPETLMPVTGDPIEVQFGFPWQSTLGVSVSQLVVDGTYFLGLKAARTFVELSERSANRSREELAYQVSKAYLQALVARQQLDQLEANLGRIQQLLKETKALQENGFAEKIDVDRLQITYNNLMVNRKKILRYADLSLDLLKFQMAMPLEADITLSETVESLSATPDISASLDPSLARQRTEYGILDNQLRLENFNLRRFRAGYFPSIYAFGSYQWNAQRNAFNFFSGSENWFTIGVVGLTVNVPVFDGFRKHNQMQQSRLAILKIENQIATFEQAAILEMRQAQAELLNAVEGLETQKENVALARKVYEVSRIKYKEGVGSSLEVNEAETQLKTAESNLLNGTLEYLLAKLNWQKARGEFKQYHLLSD